MMGVLANLFLGHLIADFPLQTTRLFHLKLKSAKGAALHALVHLIVNAILFAPSFLSVWPALVVLYLIHTFQDHMKVRLGGENINTPAPFLLDQFLHFTVLSLAVMVPPLSRGAQTLIGGSLAWWLSGLIASTFFATVMLYVLARTLPGERRDLAIDARRKTIDFCLNGLLFAGISTGYYAVAAVALTFKVFFWKYEIGESYYSSYLELIVGPMWALLNALLARTVSGI
jgi:hypothetical protein